MAASTTQAHDLWKKAVDTLDPQVFAGLNPAKTGMYDIVSAALKVAKTKHDESVRRRWRMPRRGKQDIIVRDVMEKIIGWIDRFKDVGDNAVQYDPGHAALPWAAVRFVLQSVVNYTEVEREILEGIELVTRLLAGFREVEKLYLGPGALVELEDALVGAYVTILESLAEAVRYLSESKKVHGLKAAFRTPRNGNIENLHAREHEVRRFTILIDAKRLRDVSQKVNRIPEPSAITDKAVEGQKYKDILSWLSATRYDEHHDEQRKLRIPGTGTWLLQHVEYLSWHQESSSSILVVHGIPGCGKTILSSLVIDESTSVQRPTQTKPSVAFFYCSASVSEPDRQNAASVLRSLLRQLTIAASRYPKIHSAVLTAYDNKIKTAKQQGFDLTPLPIQDCEDLIVAALEDNPATLVIDALDEMDDPYDLMDSLHTISTKARNVVKIMITTRESSPTKHKIPTARMVQVKLADNQSDVEQFITSRVDQLFLRRSIPQDTRTKLVASLASGAGEMFQWAKLQLSQLQASKLPAIEHDLTDQLSNFAKSTLDELYGTIFEALLGSGRTTRDMVIQAFSWILYAREPLTIDALLVATAGSSGCDTLSPETMLDVCRGFVHIDSQSRIVRFDHQSVRSFLQSQTLFVPQQAQTLITLSCLRIFREPPLGDPTGLQPTQKPYDYAALYFGHHVSMLDANIIDSSTAQNIEEFLFDGMEAGLYTKIWLDHASATYATLPRAHPQKTKMEAIISDSGSPLFPVCAFNMIFVLQNHDWPPTYDWDQRNKAGHTALYMASYSGYAATVAFLLNRHVNPDIECGRLGSALQCAAYRGHHETVRLLVDHGSDAKLERHFESAVHAACKGDSEHAVMALLQKGFEIRTQDEYESVESEIAKAGLSQAMTELQRHPFSNKASSDRTFQLVTDVIANGEVNGLNYLLRKSPSANVIPAGSLAISALHGHEKMTTFLIDQGIAVDEVGELGTPLRCASVNGHNNICNVLLGRGAKIDENGPFGSALHAAAMRGQLHTAKLLLDFGANANIRGGYYGTPLQAAAYHGHTEMIRLLLAAKANVHAAGFSKDAIHAAAEGGCHDAVQLFFDAGFQPLTNVRQPVVQMKRSVPRPNILRDSSPSRSGRGGRRKRRSQHGLLTSADPLNVASSAPAFFPADEWLDRESRESRNYMLEAAAALGHQDVVVTLLSDKTYRREIKDSPEVALTAACRHGHTGIVKEMLCGRYQFEINLYECFHKATLGGHSDVARILLDRLINEETSASFFEDVLTVSMPCSPRTPDETLHSMKQAATRSDVQSVLSKCLPEAAQAGWPEIVKAIIDELPAITCEDLTDAFRRGCEAGSVSVASVLYSSCDPSPISSSQLVRQTKLAAQAGHDDLLRYLLGNCTDMGLEQDLSQMLCLAAGGGFCQPIITLLSWGAARGLVDQKLLNICLISGAENGHFEVCEYLISQGAMPLQGSTLPLYYNMTDRESNALDLQFLLGEPKVIQTDALQTCLCGFERFTRREPGYFLLRSRLRTTNLADEQAQTKTLKCLLDSIVRLEENDLSHRLCIAAEHCSPEALRLVLEKGASFQPVTRVGSLLELAIAREHSEYTIMQLILNAGGTHELETAHLQRLLNSSLVKFVEDPRHGYDDLFPRTGSLDELFVSGCGAVVQYLLKRLSHEDATGDGYATLLQTAAAAGKLDLVDLLIARKVDVNATGSYYGTALQAACRYAHTDVAEALLNAGADPNLLEGEYYTALRAAVVSGSLPTVLLLLRFHADTELTGSCRWDTSNMQPAPLRLAMQEKQAAIACALVDAGATIASAQCEEVWPTLLVTACEWGECSVVRRLIAVGANIHETRPLQGGRFPSAMHAAISGGHHGVVELLVSHGFDLTASFPRAEDILTCAVRYGDPVMVAMLLKLLPGQCDAMMLQASKAAIRDDLPMILEELLDAAWDANSSPVLLDLCKTACRWANESTVQLLFDRLFALDAESFISSALAEIDIRTVRSELFELWPCYFPFTVELFVEACVRGDVAFVQRGIDLGHKPDDEDKWARSPLHFAAARSKESVVRALLEAGADVTHMHARYGDAIQSALEGLSAAQLALEFTTDSHRPYLEELAGLDFDNFMTFDYRQCPSTRGPQVARKLTEKCHKTVELLLSYGARADSPPGRFGTALALAAFAGLDETFDMLVIRGANVREAGGALGSPLSVAIDQGHVELVDKMLDMASRSGYPPSTKTDYLHRACEIGSLAMVLKLLEYGHNPGREDDKRRTALSIALEKFNDDRELRPNMELIVHVLLDADTRPILSSNELEDVASITDSRAQDKILDRITVSLENHKMPEESFLRLLKSGRRYGSVVFLRRLLDKHAISSITTPMLASASNARTMELLLDYDPSYVVTSATVDAVPSGSQDDERDMVKMLLLRNPSLIPTESQVLKVLASGRDTAFNSTRNAEMTLLDLTFDRNPSLSVTQAMVEAVRRPNELKALLARLEPGKRVVTDRVLEELTPPRRTNEDDVSSHSEFPRALNDTSGPSLKSRPIHWQELLEILLEFEPSAKIPSEIAQQLLRDGNVDTVELMLNHDNSISLSSDKIVSMINGYDFDCDAPDQRKFAKTLENHPGQYTMTQEVKAAVDSRLRLHSEKPLKDMYYDLAGWTSTEVQ